jgi:hypothetical protein
MLLPEPADFLGWFAACRVFSLRIYMDLEQLTAMQRRHGFGNNPGTSAPVAMWAVVAAVALALAMYFVMRR